MVIKREIRVRSYYQVTAAVVETLSGASLRGLRPPSLRANAGIKLLNALLLPAPDYIFTPTRR